MGVSLGGQVDEVAQFVADNARRVLGVDTAKVLPVSARAALQAKLDATHSSNGFFGESHHPPLPFGNQSSMHCWHLSNL